MQGAATIIPTSHIRLDEQGRAWIDDTNVKVIEVACDKVGYGWTEEQMHAEHPDLSLAQIHAALAYYYDHREEFDAEIARQVRNYDDARMKARNSPLREKLRASGRLQ